MKYYTKQTLRIFWKHIQKYRLHGLILILSITCGTIANLIPPILYKHFFDILAEAKDITTKIPELIQIIVRVLLVYLVGWIFWRLATFFTSYFQSKIMADLANTCFAHLHKHSFSFFQNNFVGSLVKRVSRFYRAFGGIADAVTWDLLTLSVDVVFIIIILFWRNSALGIGVLVWIIFFALINYFFSIYKLKYDIQRSELDSKVTGVLADTITNHSNIKFFCGYQRERRGFSDVTAQLQKMRRWTWDLGSIFEAIQALLMIGLEFGIFYIAIQLWQRQIISLGDFVLIQAYLLTIFHRFWNFGKIVRHFYEHLADAEEMTEILDEPYEVINIKRAKELKVKRGKIEFINVNFNYHKTRRVISKLNLLIKAKQKVALVGPSGAGKTTVIKLLLRMYNLTSGKINIDGQRLSRVTQESLWQNISLVPQDPILFHRTLAENIRYGKPRATDEQVIAVAKLANCYEFISEFPLGYDTYVGERGIKLSGGERQRVAIARAILYNAPILVLDEATSSLDSESERLIQEALDNLMKDKTVIVIAHRLSTIMKMDRIVVMNYGQIIEDGTHKQLLSKRGGLYRKLWKMQAGGFIYH